MYSASSTTGEPIRIPGEFHYWQNRDKPHVKRARLLFKTLFRFDPELPQDVIETYASSFYTADPVAEEFVDEVYLKGDPVKGRAMLDKALEEGIDAVPDAPASMKRLFAEREIAPEWLDAEKVAYGAKIFRRYGPELFTFFGAITLEGYSNNSVVKPLILTGAYAGGTTKTRFLETAAFWNDVSELDALVPGGAGWKTSMRVRIMHVFVRRRLINHPEWNERDWGVPISQGDALITLMAGCIAPGFVLRLAGFRTSEKDIEALMHFWRYVGYLMGVQPPWFPSTVKEGLQFSFLAYAAGANKAGEDGTNLCSSFNDAFAPKEEQLKGWRQKLQARLDHGVHRGFVSFFVSPATRQQSGIPFAGLWAALPLASAPAVFATETLVRRFPRLDEAVDKLARRRRQSWLDRHMGKRKAEYTAVAHFTR